MKLISELIGTFKVGQHYEVKLSPLDTWYEEFDSKKITCAVIDIDTDDKFIGVPYFTACVPYFADGEVDYCWFLPEFTKVKLIDDM